MKTDLNIFKSNDFYPYIGLFSFPAFILLNNLLYNLILILTGYEPSFLWFGYKCSLHEVVEWPIDSGKFSILIIYALARLLVVVIPFLLIIRNILNGHLILLSIQILVSIFIFDLAGVIAFMLEHYYDLTYFNFFLSNIMVFELSKLAGMDFYVLPLIFGLVGLGLLGVLLKKFQFNFWKNLAIFGTVLSASLIMVIGLYQLIYGN